MTPKPAGEGKTTTVIGLGDALIRIGQKTVVCIRGPSLGPVFGLKGGATGGGRAQVVPMVDINLHFTGDFHAVGAAHNLLAALIDNHIYWGNNLGIDERCITWKRALDINDRALREIVSSLGGVTHGFPRGDGFDITAASEVMATLCLAKNLSDLTERLGRIVIGPDRDRRPVLASGLKTAGPMSVLLRDAIHPNLVQTLEHNPTLVHGGPFADIAHGCSSVIATKAALKLADYVVTEAGGGSDLDAEKFFHIKCRQADLKPKVAVVVLPSPHSTRTTDASPSAWPRPITVSPPTPASRVYRRAMWCRSANFGWPPAPGSWSVSPAIPKPCRACPRSPPLSPSASTGPARPRVFSDVPSAFGASEGLAPPVSSDR